MTSPTDPPAESGFAASFDRATAAAGVIDELEQTPLRAAGASGEEVERRLRRLGLVEPRSGATARLAVRAARGDPDAREQLMSASLPMVVRAARRYAGADLELSDLVQEGALGVLRALERYDPARGVRFEAYAAWWVRQSMQQAVAEQSRSLRLPTHVLWDIHRLREARADLYASNGREASARELEQRLEWSEGHLDDVLRAERPALSLDEPFSGDAGQVDRLGDLIADPLSEQAYEESLARVAGDSMRTLLSTLTERERRVLAWRYGVDGEELSLRQIGRRLGMSGERVRQIEQRALIKLRSASVTSAAGG